MPSFTLLHADHGIASAQLSYIYDVLGTQVEEGTLNEGFFIQEVTLIPTMGTVPCGLHGPAMGDAPIKDDEVTLEVRGDREWPDRLIKRDTREVDFVQAIGVVDEANDRVILFTLYGGPLAPQNAADPSNKDVAGSTKFWAEHALSS